MARPDVPKYRLFEVDLRIGGLQTMEEYYVLCEGEKLDFALPERWKVSRPGRYRPSPELQTP